MDNGMKESKRYVKTNTRLYDRSHNCRQVSYFTFSNIQMSSIDEF